MSKAILERQHKKETELQDQRAEKELEAKLLLGCFGAGGVAAFDRALGSWDGPQSCKEEGGRPPTR